MGSDPVQVSLRSCFTGDSDAYLDLNLTVPAIRESMALAKAKTCAPSAAGAVHGCSRLAVRFLFTARVSSLQNTRCSLCRVQRTKRAARAEGADIRRAFGPDGLIVVWRYWRIATRTSGWFCHPLLFYPPTDGRHRPLRV